MEGAADDVRAVDTKRYRSMFEVWLFFSALMECHMDAGRKSDASHIATAALTFIKSNAPHLFKKAFGLMVRRTQRFHEIPTAQQVSMSFFMYSQVRYQLVESSKFQKDMRVSPELNIYYRICRLKL